MKTFFAYPPSATICGSGKLAFAHSSNINFMPRTQISTILREYITLAIVGFHDSFLFQTWRADRRVGHLYLGRDGAQPSHVYLTLSIMPFQDIHFALIRPSVYIINKPSTHRVVPHIFPLRCITVAFAELRVPTFALK